MSTSSGFFAEFKTFIARGNVLDLAVGVIIGGAFSNITTSLVNDIINPILGILTGGHESLSALAFQLPGGGALMLGVSKPVIKAHGSSKARAFQNAIRQAKLCVANDLCGTMQSALAEVAAKAAAEKTDAE